MEIEIRHKALNLRVVSVVLEPISFARRMEETIRVSAELAVICVSNVSSHATRSDNVLRWVLRVNITVPQLSTVTRISRVRHLVPPVGNAQTDSMLFSPNSIRKVLLMWSLVHYKFTIYIYILYYIREIFCPL